MPSNREEFAALEEPLCATTPSCRPRCPVRSSSPQEDVLLSLAACVVRSLGRVVPPPRDRFAQVWGVLVGEVSTHFFELFLKFQKP